MKYLTLALILFTIGCSGEKKDEFKIKPSKINKCDFCKGLFYEEDLNKIVKGGNSGEGIFFACSKDYKFDYFEISFADRTGKRIEHYYRDVRIEVNKDGNPLYWRKIK